MKKKAKAEQEELAFDLKMLEQLLEESRNEAMEQMQRKVSSLWTNQGLNYPGSEFIVANTLAKPYKIDQPMR